ncbi:tRNA (adenosine(37)-N6)-threonylcarbamoyltransferase complex ATPase subunit type 1 TsaE [soil metagenome]
MMTVFTYDIQDIISTAGRLLEISGTTKIFTFAGDLGAGKTTLVACLCRELGSMDTINSPTFSLINEYKANDSIIYHMDMYRIRSLQEAIDAGVEDCLISGEICMIEWPEKIESLLPTEYTSVTLTTISHTVRNLKIELHK